MEGISMKKLLVLVGKTCSGKTEILKELTKEGYINPIVTYSTRPKRPGEVDGVTYNFVTKEKFHEMIENDEFIEYTSYNVASGEEWFYGTSRESLKRENAAIILNPRGVKAFCEKDVDMRIVYIKCSEQTIKERLLSRGDNEAESLRRIAADNEDFKDMDCITDMTVWNEGVTVHEAAQMVKMFGC